MNGFLQMLANAGIMMDYDGFKTVFDTNPQLKNVIAQFNKDEITFVGDSDDEGAGYEEPQGDMPDDERVAKMAQRATKMRTEEFVEGYEVLPKMDRDKYQERDGLEGPIMTRSGKVVYYDAKEGKYYDPDTDIYLSYDDYKMLDKKTNEELTFEDDDQFFEEFGYLGYSIDEADMFEAEYQGRKVKLNKPMQGDVKKFKVYVKDPKTGNVKKVNFGHGGSSVKGKAMRIRKSNPAARKSFRARHNCDNPGPKTKARYWSCRKW